MLTHSLHKFSYHDGSMCGETHCKLSGEIYFWDRSSMSRGRGELRTFDGVSVAVEHAHIDRLQSER